MNLFKKKVKFNETIDNIESLFKNKIIKFIPNYTYFWEEFYGLNTTEYLIDRTKLLPYGIRYKNGMDKDLKKKIDKSYNKINQIYYQLICNLCYAWEIENKNKRKNFSKKKFIFLKIKNLQNFYLSLGICRDMIGNLFNEIFIKLSKMRIKKIKEKRNILFMNTFIEYLNKKHTKLSKRMNAWNRKITRMRNFLSHSSSKAILFKFKDKNKIPEMYIIKNPPSNYSNLTWEEIHNKMDKSNKIELKESFKLDLKETEYIVNESFRLFSEEYKNFFNKNKNKFWIDNISLNLTKKHQ